MEINPVFCYFVFIVAVVTIYVYKYSKFGVGRLLRVK